jgi:hypothetical protein
MNSFRQQIRPQLLALCVLFRRHGLIILFRSQSQPTIFGIQLLEYMKNNPHLVKLNLLIILVASLCLALVNPRYVEADVNAITNAEGWKLELSAPTNSYIAGDKVIVSLVVSNTTQKAGKIEVFNDWYNNLSLPTFGEMQVIDVKTGVALKFHAPLTSGGDDVGGGINASNSMRFNFDLTKLYALTNSGTYSIGFEGHLKSILDSQKEVEFSVPPLTLNVSSVSH